MPTSWPASARCTAVARPIPESDPVTMALTGPTPSSACRDCACATGTRTDMAVTYEAESAAPPRIARALMARPRLWSVWAPHIRGAWGLGAPEIEAGRRGAVRLLGALPVPARIVAKDAGRSWRRRVGPVELTPRGEPPGSGRPLARAPPAPPPPQAAPEGGHRPPAGPPRAQPPP